MSRNKKKAVAKAEPEKVSCFLLVPLVPRVLILWFLWLIFGRIRFLHPDITFAVCNIHIYFPSAPSAFDWLFLCQEFLRASPCFLPQFLARIWTLNFSVFYWEELLDKYSRAERWCGFLDWVALLSHFSSLLSLFHFFLFSYFLFSSFLFSSFLFSSSHLF